MRFASIVALGVIFASSMLAQAEDWPKWLGPREDGISKETGLAESWPAGGPAKVWSNNVGLGYCSPIAVDGKVYIMALVGTQDVLYCFDAAKGTPVWKQAYDGGYTGEHKGTRATPTIADGKIYTYGGNGQLVCRNVADGSQVWLTNILKGTGAGNLQWGVASAPLLYNNRIYVQGGKNGPVAVAVNKDDGKILLESERGLGGYAHIIVVPVDGAKQLLVFGGNTIYGMDPETLKTIWSHPWKTSWDVNAATPLFRDGNAFFTSDYKHGCIMFKVSATGAQKLWENKEMMSHFQPCILENDVLYGNSESVIKCLSWADGKTKWALKQRLGNGASLVRVGEKLIIMSEGGLLMLAKAGPEGCTIISQFQLFDGTPIWSTPLIYNGKLYAKGVNELVCLDIAAK